MALRSQRRDYWQRLVDEFEANGMTQAAFLAERGLSKSTFGKWWRRLRSAPRGPGGRPTAPLRLVEIEVAAEATPTPALFELVLPGGFPLRFDAGGGPDYVAGLAVAFSRTVRR